jgi:transcriptional regulator with XRE-family HTH domain
MSDGIGRKVKPLRDKLGLPQEKFAWLLGLTFVSVSRYETGRTVPTGYSVVAFELLEVALRHHSPEVVASRLREAAGDQTEIVRALVTLECEKTFKKRNVR